MKYFLTFLLFIVSGAALADPPMKTIYKSTSGTKFVWQWPFRTIQSTTSVQTHLAPAGNGLHLQTSWATREDVSQYRFHNPQLTYHNQWGYFFPAATRPVIQHGAVLFQSPEGYYQSR